MTQTKYIKINNKGSLSLEAAIALPIFICAILAIISYIEIFRAYSDIETSLCQAGREIALYASAEDIVDSYSDNDGTSKDTILTILSDGYAINKLNQNYSKENGQSIKVAKSSISPLSFYNTSTSYDDGLINYSLEYTASPLFNMFGLGNIPLSHHCYLHLWTGYTTSDYEELTSDERMVYITETGTVYHLSKTCTYLDLSISSIESTSIDSERNNSGGKYYSCELCNPLLTGTLYITDFGDRYHSSLSCSGLKRTIFEVPLSQIAESMNCCSRCKN